MTGAPFRVVVLTCSSLGLETADALAELDGVNVVSVFMSPHRKPSFRRRLRRVYRSRGLVGTLGFLAGKAARALARRTDAAPVASPRHGVPVVSVSSFHDDDALRALGDARPDLAVVDGTYILKESVFNLPPHGSINLHCGKVPEFRGSPPAFWELYAGVEQVGITIHRVAVELDAGPILAEESFPFNTRPSTDPVEYVTHFWRTVLRPNGVRMLCTVVSEIAAGLATERPQPPHDGPPNRSPSFAETRELRRRVRLRQKQQAVLS